MRRKKSMSSLSSRYPILLYGGMVAVGATLLWFLYVKPKQQQAFGSGGSGYIGNVVGTVETR